MNKITVKGICALMVCCFIFYACQSGGNSQKVSEQTNLQEEVSSGDTIPYVEAQRYFVNNTYKDSGVKKITAQNEFDVIFGMAAIMGSNGKPTEIDFAKNYVIAVIGSESNKKPEIIINSLKKEGENIALSYSIKEEEETSSTSKPNVILIIDKRYEGELKVEVK